jgi:YHS domain-containing protein
MGESLKDPVCGAEVLQGRITAVFLGVEYSFCTTACRDRFLAYPHQYAGLRGQRRPRRDDESARDPGCQGAVAGRATQSVGRR